MMDLSENFLKLLQIALTVTGVLAIYFTFVSYNVTVQSNTASREAIILSNYLLSSGCITYSETKSLFSEDKLDSMVANSKCLKDQNLHGAIDVTVDGLGKSWSINIGDYANTGDKSQVNVAIKMSNGEVKTGVLTVKL
jgi:transketolase N-terminal domain/subunit